MLPPPNTRIGRTVHEMQPSLSNGEFNRAGGRDIQCSLPFVMDNALGTYIATTEDAGRAGGTLSETFTQGWGVRSGGRGIKSSLHDGPR